jgi:hypothetical protein
MAGAWGAAVDGDRNSAAEGLRGICSLALVPLWGKAGALDESAA